MSIVIPILFFAVAMGLFVPRMTRLWWFVLGGWIMLILIYNYLKPLPISAQQKIGQIRYQNVRSERQS